jgi:Bacterial archaeo-eukaryotic release factor family 3
MTILNREELHSLIGKQNDHCVSIYLPTHRTEAETREDPLELKGLMREAENRLLALGLWATKAHELLKPAQGLLDQEYLWRPQSGGLALFLTEGFFRYYSLPHRFPKLAVVSDRFHLKPLLRYFTSEDRFYLLALGQNQVRVFQGSRHSLNEICLEGMPLSLADNPGEEEPQKILRFHSGALSRGRRAAVFHDQVGEDEVRKCGLRHFFRWIDVSLQDILREEHAPLVLAGAEHLHPIYRSASTYPHLPIEGIYGDPQQMPLEELHKKTWTIVQSHYRRARKEAEELYWELTGTGKTTDRVSDAIAAAVHGRIDTLFVQVNIQSLGSFDGEQNGVTPHADTQFGDELLELMALRTLTTGGTVFAVPREQMPYISPVAAIFR